MRADKQSDRRKTSWLYKPPEFSPAGCSGLNQLVELLLSLFGCPGGLGPPSTNTDGVTLYYNWPHRSKLLVRLSQLVQFCNLITSWIILPQAGAGLVVGPTECGARITKLIIIFGHGHYGTFLIYY